MVERDGEAVEHVGRLLELDRPRRLVFTWTVAGDPVGSRIVVELEAEGHGVRIHVAQELHPAWADRAAAAAAEWGRRLDVLAVALAAIPPAGPPRLGGG
jgi:uncharacterized protein YndB with AHSA1/START domain